ncbi:MAG: hypothetical protein IJN13_03695 [Bacilli bacterium]|nr:hypothetical protein [Bacilli bacterium]
MEQKDLQKIYDRALENSVGNNKKCPFKKVFKTVVMKIALLTLLITFLASCMVGCFGNYKEEDINFTQSGEAFENDGKTNGFSTYQISTYQNLRLYDLLEAYDFTDFTLDGTKRDYHYTEEQYSQIQELDETYLYAFYTQTTPATLTAVCKSLGYDNLESFLLDNGYVDKEGKPSISIWYQHNKVEMSKIMKKAQEDLNQGAR